MGVFGRILPRTIATQIASLVVISLLLAHGITIAVLLSFRTEPVPMRGQAIAVRIATIAQLANAAETPADVESILASARRAGISVESVPFSSLMIDPKGAAASLFAGRFGRLLEGGGINVIENASVPGKTDLLVVQADGYERAIVFSSLPESRTPRFFTGPPVLILSIVTVFTIVLSVYAARWITAPLSSFAAAANSFGRYPAGDRPLAETGPREILQLAQALNEMRTRIRTLVDDRTRMVAAIGHDLRTPLTRLRLRAERLGESTVQQGMIRDITSINNMLTETLSYVRDDLRSGKNSRIDLPSLLQTICSEFADIGHRVAYRGADRLVYWCRPSALSRALTNLIDNGLKHGTQVSVTLRSDDAGIEIQVLDDGPGIPAEWRDKAFEPFFKGDATRSGDEGAGFGLGLSIARDIVRGHGGEIELQDHSPRGLAVRVVLPLKGADSDPRAAAAPASRAPVGEPA